MKKGDLKGLSLNKRTVSALSKSAQKSLYGGGNTDVNGTYPQDECCGYGGGGSGPSATTALAGCQPNSTTGITGCV